MLFIVLLLLLLLLVAHPRGGVEGVQVAPATLTFCKIPTSCPVIDLLPAEVANNSNLSFPSSVVIEGVNYGLLLCADGTSLFLQTETIVFKQEIYSARNYHCPPGFQPPSVMDLMAAISTPDPFLTSPSLWQGNTSLFYVSNEKTYLNITSGSPHAYYFKVLKWVENVPKIDDLNTGMYYSSLRTKCVVDPDKYSVDIVGFPSGNAVVNSKVVLTASATGAVSFLWLDSYGNVLSTTSSVTFTPTATGCVLLTLKIRLFCNVVVSRCYPIYVSKSSSPLTSESDVISQTLPFNATRTNSVFFARGGVVLHPIEGIGAFAVFSAKSTNLVTIVALNYDGSIIQSTVLDIAAYVLDFTVIPVFNDLVILAIYTSNVNHFFIQRVSYQGLLRWRKTIMNNAQAPAQPSTAVNQIPFSSNFGMNAMFKTENGKIMFGNDKLFIIFGHYNYFGASGSHTGDTIVVMLPYDPSNITLISNWGSSHSLVQHMVFNPSTSTFMVAALGDAFPEDITVDFWNSVTLQFDNQLKPIAGTFPGDGLGYSCGHLGEVSLTPTLGGYSLTYQRKACNESKGNKTNTVTELGVVFLDQGYNLIKNSSLNVPEVVNVYLLRSAWLGSALVVIYGTTTKMWNTGSECPSATYSERDTKMYYMVLDLNGNIITQPFNASWSITASDNIVTLSDGSIMWPYIAPNGTIIINRLPTGLSTTTPISELPPSPAYTGVTGSESSLSSTAHKLHPLLLYAITTATLLKLLSFL